MNEDAVLDFQRDLELDALREKQEYKNSKIEVIAGWAVITLIAGLALFFVQCDGG